MWNDATLWNVGTNTPLLEKDGGWNVGYSFFAAFCFYSTHTTTLAQNLLAFAWHHGMERTNTGRVGEDGVRGPRRFHGDSNACTTAQRGGHTMGGNTLHYSQLGMLREGIQSFNDALHEDQHVAVTFPVPLMSPLASNTSGTEPMFHQPNPRFTISQFTHLSQASYPEPRLELTDEWVA